MSFRRPSQDLTRPSMEYQHLVAGVTGGFLSTLALHPLDLLKVRFSANDGNLNIRPKDVSYWQTAKAIYKIEGLRGLYKGASPNLIGSTSSWGLYFMFYDYLKRYLQRHCEEEHLQPKHTLPAGMLAGIATLTLTNPIWVAKTRLCLQYENQKYQYTSLRHALRSLLTEEGFIRGWYKGYLPGLIGTTHGALQFMAYDELKKRLETHNFKGPLLHITCAALSKMFAASTTYPYQVVRTRLMDYHVHYRSTADVVKQTFMHEGLSGFYKGMLACLLKVTPASCITFVVYEEINRLLR